MNQQTCPCVCHEPNTTAQHYPMDCPTCHGKAQVEVKSEKPEPMKCALHPQITLVQVEDELRCALCDIAIAEHTPADTDTKGQDIEIAEAARPYYSLPLADAMQIARENIDEWSYEEDPHGYCHDRSVLVALYQAVAAHNADVQAVVREAIEDTAKKLTRLTVIDHTKNGEGVVFERYNIAVEIMVQDDGTTLKVRALDQKGDKAA